MDGKQMKYSREQDIKSIRASFKTGKPKRRALVKRLYKKYGFTGIGIIINALFPYTKRKRKAK
jgi:hypothetical protein